MHVHAAQDMEQTHPRCTGQGMEQALGRILPIESKRQVSGAVPTQGLIFWMRCQPSLWRLKSLVNQKIFLGLVQGLHNITWDLNRYISLYLF